MIEDKRQLLCTFANPKNYKSVSQEIHEFYSIYNNKIFVFVNTKSDKELFLTYNIICEKKEFPKFANTISIHRKKLTNTLYTLNSLNQLIEEECGKKDPNYILDWSLFKDSLIITGNISVRIISIKIYDVIK